MVRGIVGVDWDSPEAPHTEGTLVRQLKLKWLQMVGSQGPPQCGYPNRTIHEREVSTG